MNRDSKVSTLPVSETLAPEKLSHPCAVAAICLAVAYLAKHGRCLFPQNVLRCIEERRDYFLHPSRLRRAEQRPKDCQKSVAGGKDGGGGRRSAAAGVGLHLSIVFRVPIVGIDSSTLLSVSLGYSMLRLTLPAPLEAAFPSSTA